MRPHQHTTLSNESAGQCLRKLSLKGTKFWIIHKPQFAHSRVKINPSYKMADLILLKTSPPRNVILITMNDTVHNSQPTWAGNDTQPMYSPEERIFPLEKQVSTFQNKKNIDARFRKRPSKREDCTEGTQYRFSQYDCKPD